MRAPRPCHAKTIRRRAPIPRGPVLLVPILLSSILASFLTPSAASAQSLDDDALRQALAGFQEKVAAGDLQGAIADLESVREQREDAPQQVDAMLGALYVEVGRHQDALQLLEPLAEADGANPAVVYNAGRAAMALDDFATADRLLTRAVRQAPDSPAARELGLLRGRLGQIPESYALLRRWVSAHPGDAEARLAAAAGAVQLNRPMEAETLLSELPQQDLGVRLLWGRTLLQKGDPYGAIGYLEALVADAPEEMQNDVRGSLAEAYNLIGDSARAVDLLDGLADDDPKMALNLAIARYRNGELESALATLRPFAESLLSNDDYRSTLGPELRGSLPLEYGRMLLNDGRAAEAATYLEIAVAERPNSRIAWQNLGQALAAEGDRERAQAALERFRVLSEGAEAANSTAEEDTEDPTGRALREAMRLLGSDPELALQRIRSEAAIAPTDPRPRLFEARALLLLERPREALEIAQAVAATLGGRGAIEADALYLVGSSQMALQRLDEAESNLRKALTLSADHTGAMSDLAVLLMSLDRNDEARDLFERVLEIRPGDPVARASLERLDADAG